ncbi:MAG: purine-nucleoside phosphorylase [Planctomycetes bacterium]|nr:purine-nucleoside phosphorylase [Planctomycetota bacterium]
MALHEQLETLSAQVRKRCDLVPKVALLLGTGLGGVAERLEVVCRIPYSELAGMPRSTAESHKGEVVLGHLSKVPVVAFSGRLHCYEGHTPADVVVPVRLGRHLGAKSLIMGSAVGGLNPQYQIGDLVAIEDHINLMGVNPLVGPNDDRIGPRWPDMIHTYDPQLLKIADEVAMEARIRLHRGVYAGVLGPNLETRAEYRMLRTLGSDVVGMSTIPEAVAAVHCGLKTLAFAIVTDRCLPDALEAANVPAIIAAANAAEPILTKLITGLLPRIV